MNDFKKAMIRVMAASEGENILRIFERFTTSLEGGRKIDEQMLKEMAQKLDPLREIADLWPATVLHKLGGGKENKAVAVLKATLALTPGPEGRLHRIKFMLAVIRGVMTKQRENVGLGGEEEQKAMITIGGTLGDISVLLVEELEEVK